MTELSAFSSPNAKSPEWSQARDELAGAVVCCQLGNSQVGQDTQWQYNDGVGLFAGAPPYLDWRFTYPPPDALLWGLVAKIAS